MYGVVKNILTESGTRCSTGRDLRSCLPRLNMSIIKSALMWHVSWMSTWVARRLNDGTAQLGKRRLEIQTAPTFGPSAPAIAGQVHHPHGCQRPLEQVPHHVPGRHHCAQGSLCMNRFPHPAISLGLAAPSRGGRRHVHRKETDTKHRCQDWNQWPPGRALGPALADVGPSRSCFTSNR